MDPVMPLHCTFCQWRALYLPWLSVTGGRERKKERKRVNDNCNKGPFNFICQEERELSTTEITLHSEGRRLVALVPVIVSHCSSKQRSVEWRGFKLTCTEREIERKGGSKKLHLRRLQMTLASWVTTRTLIDDWVAREAVHLTEKSTVTRRHSSVVTFCSFYSLHHTHEYKKIRICTLDVHQIVLRFISFLGTFMFSVNAHLH